MSEAVAVPVEAAERPTMVRWGVMAFAALLALTIYLHRSAMSPARTTILAEFQAAGFEVNDAVMGNIQAAFSWGYLFQVVGSFVGARFGNRIALTFFAVASSAAIFGSGLAASPDMLWWMMFAIGVSQAGIIPCVSQLIKDWIEVPRRGIASGIFTGAMSTGSALGALTTGALLASVSWQAIFFGYAAIGLMWSLAFAAWFRNRPQEHPQVNLAELDLIRAVESGSQDSRPRTSWKVWWAMLTCWNQWMNCIQQFCRNFFFIFFITGFPAFLQYAYGVSVSKAGVLSAVPLTTAILGVLVGGHLIDLVLRRTGNRWLSRSGLAVFGHLTCGALVLSAAWAPDAVGAVTLIGIGIFFFGFSSPCTWAATMDIAGKHTSPFIAVANTVGVVAGICSPQIAGRMFDQAKAGTIGWNQIFFLFAGVNLLAALCWMSLNSKHAAKLPE